MSIDSLLERLDGTRRTGDGRWIARCPAHQDKHPSLAVREVSDGRVLLHCFAGCDVESVLASVDLDFTALFPERSSDTHYYRSERRPFPAFDVLRCISFEAMVVAIAASRIGNGKSLPAVDLARLLVAASRLDEAARAAGYVD